MITSKEIYDYYLEVKSMRKTSKHFKKCSKTIIKLFKKSNYLYPVKGVCNKIKVNEDYFENIDTQNKAYILGYIYADGCVTYTKRKNNTMRYSLGFNMILEDREIGDFIIKELEFTGNTFIKPPHNRLFPGATKISNCKAQFRFNINRKKLVEDLIKLGLCHRKTYSNLRIPNISNHLIPHFIRGFMDGDGCISEKTAQCCSYTKFILIDICNFYNFKINYVEKRKDETVYRFRFNQKDSLIFLHSIYNNHNFCLQRKFKKYVQLKSCELLETPEIDKCLNN